MNIPIYDWQLKGKEQSEKKAQSAENAQAAVEESKRLYAEIADLQKQLSQLREENIRLNNKE